VREPRGVREFGAGRRRKEDGKPEVVLNFAETHETLMKVKSFMRTARVTVMVKVF
jgi:hypothetical protein